MSLHLKEIQQRLTASSKKKDIAFFQKMVPGKQKVYGVKTPELNSLAKAYRKFSFVLAEELWQSGALEEKIIAIKIIEKEGKQDPEMLFKLFKQFAKDVDNWAVCDGLGMQFLRGVVHTHESVIFALAKTLSRSTDPWQRRLALVMVEWYTRKKETHPEILRLVKTLEQDKEYYVKKAVLWIKRNLQKNKFQEPK